MNDLINNQSIIIKSCDKGGGICIMNTRDYLTKIHIDLQDHNPKKLLTHNPTNAIAHDALHYMDSQLIIDMTTMEFLLPARIRTHLSSMSYQKCTSQTALSALLF